VGAPHHQELEEEFGALEIGGKNKREEDLSGSEEDDFELLSPLTPALSREKKPRPAASSTTGDADDKEMDGTDSSSRGSSHFRNIFASPETNPFLQGKDKYAGFVFFFLFNNFCEEFFDMSESIATENLLQLLESLCYEDVIENETDLRKFLHTIYSTPILGTYVGVLTQVQRDEWFENEEAITETTKEIKRGSEKLELASAIIQKLKPPVEKAKAKKVTLEAQKTILEQEFDDDENKFAAPPPKKGKKKSSATYRDSDWETKSELQDQYNNLYSRWATVDSDLKKTITFISKHEPEYNQEVDKESSARRQFDTAKQNLKKYNDKRAELRGLMITEDRVLLAVHRWNRDRKTKGLPDMWWVNENSMESFFNGNPRRNILLAITSIAFASLVGYSLYYTFVKAPAAAALAAEALRKLQAENAGLTTELELLRKQVISMRDQMVPNIRSYELHQTQTQEIITFLQNLPATTMKTLNSEFKKALANALGISQTELSETFASLTDIQKQIISKFIESLQLPNPGVGAAYVGADFDEGSVLANAFSRRANSSQILTQGVADATAQLGDALYQLLPEREKIILYGLATAGVVGVSVFLWRSTHTTQPPPARAAEQRVAKTRSETRIDLRNRILNWLEQPGMEPLETYAKNFFNISEEDRLLLNTNGGYTRYAVSLKKKLAETGYFTAGNMEFDISQLLM